MFIETMKQIITAKLKLIATPEQFKALRQTQLAYREALNHVSRFAFSHGKTSNRDKLQKGNYHDVRAMFGLPSEMSASVIHLQV